MNTNPMDPYGAPGVGQAASAYNAFGRGVQRPAPRRALGQPGAGVPQTGTNVPQTGTGTSGGYTQYTGPKPNLPPGQDGYARAYGGGSGMQVATPPPTSGSGIGVFGGLGGQMPLGVMANLAHQAQTQDEQRRKGVSGQVTP